MTDVQPETTDSTPRDARATCPRGWWVLAQTIILVALTCWAFREETAKTYQQVTSMVQSSYVLAVPGLIALLVYSRREHLKAAMRRGSVWGVIVLLLAIAAYAVTTWPFYFGYARKLTFAIALTGIVLAVGGWRVLWRSMPMLLLVFLAMPLGWFTYATLINKPERMMVRGSAMVLRMLPDTRVEVEHHDLHYTHGDTEGTIGLGEFHFGFAAPVAFLSAILFAIFVRVRPLWQVIVLLALAVPLVALGNFLRLVAHGLLTIYSSAPPTSGFPRDVSTVIALVLTYAAICFAIWLLNSLLVDDDADVADDEAEKMPGVASDG
jgi:hypothetical protein